ncbi:Fertility inhibition protein (plasmid) [Escherichia coli]|uniref:Fertility inhibition protein n=1 Tax=Escherichia coli TaxID=562 RepID=A0A2H4TKU5_ECOLX|nr:Fertility inhibition protein [Escherichia coli]
MWYLWPQEDDSSEAEHSMTEQKRPVLTLKRKTEGETPVRSRKTIINVTTPPKWKVKKQKLAEKAAREAELAAKKAQARQTLSIYLNLPTLDEAVNTLKPWWPGLFDGDTPGFWPAVSGTCYWKT